MKTITVSTMRIAIIGSGISGSGSAWLLHRDHEVTVYEAGDHIGGHTHTHDFTSDDGTTTRVDTGFIVYNRRNYPLLCRLFDELGVTGRDSTMSFSVNDPAKHLFWNGHNLKLTFAQRRNLLRPKFWCMLRDILRFNERAGDLLEAPTSLTVGDVIADTGVGAWCAEDYILPMGSSIWSSSTSQVATMPAKFFAQFLHNHGMLTINDRPQWMTVSGGSRQYVDRIVAQLNKAGQEAVRMDPVTKVRRQSDCIEVTSVAGSDQFDRVIIAAHAPQALSMLDQPNEREQAILPCFPYAPNRAMVHHDASILPPKRAWAAWNYHVSDSNQAPASVTYHANILQGIPSSRQWLISLGDHAQIDTNQQVTTLDYEHPQFIPAGIEAQQRAAEVSGYDRIHYAGAYWGYGFHEDGFASAVRVAKELGVVW